MEREPISGWKAIAPRIALALLIAAALDLILSAANGYPLIRPFGTFPPPLMESVVVLGLETLFLFPVVAVACLLLLAAHRLPVIGPVLERAPRFAVLAPATLPVVLNRLYRFPGSVEPLYVAVLLAVPIALLTLESFRPLPRPGRLEGAIAAAVAGLFVLAALGWPSLGPTLVEGETDTQRSSRPPEDGPNLLLIVLDTLRADHLSLYGYPRETSPWLDRFARTALVFDRAVAPSSFTLPSHATLFTGLYPETHGAVVRDGGVSLSELGLEDDWTPVQPLAAEAVTLAEIAAEAGLETGAVCANVAYLSRYFALDQGFRDYAVPQGGWYSWQPAGLVLARKVFGKLLPARWDWWYRSRVLGHGRYYLLASEVNRLALSWLAPRRHDRFFLFLNYMDAHAPYMPLGGYRNLFPASDAPQVVDRARIESGEREILVEEREPLVDAYDAEIRYLETIVLIVGDHGESFGEHHELEHATGLHEPQLHVPLLLRLPGQADGRRETRRVHLVDVMPTLLDALGLQRPPNLQADSLLRAERPLPIVAHLGPYGRDYSEDAIYVDQWKLIVSSRGQVELYDLSEDAGEAQNVVAERPEWVGELIDRLQTFKSEATPRFGPGESEIDPETLERLKGLGYVN